jgi:uncharacterized membrane protein
MSDAARALAIVTAIGAGLSAGVFFAFSTFVMPALRRVPDRTGMVAMQSINRAAPNPLFMLALFGSAFAAVVLCGLTVTDLGDGAAACAFAGGALHLVVAVTTIAFHVPRNDALEAVAADAPEAPAAWAGFLREWVPGNHVRTVAGVAATVLLTVSCTDGAPW